MKPISVVILNWNGAPMLRRFLPSVVANSGELAEVVVADNGSTDGSVEMLAADFPGVSVLPLGRNYGFAEGYNRAIEQIDSDYVLLLNSDVEVTPGWLRPLYDYMRANDGVAAVQPKLLAEGRRTHFEYAGAAGGYLDALGYPFCRGRIFMDVEPDNGQYDSVADVDWTSGAAMLVRTRVYKEVGGLDARFFAHMEEIDLCWRMRRAGWRLACVPQSAVYHVGGGTLPQGSPRKTFLNFRNNLLMIAKNEPDAPRVLRIRWWLDALAGFVFLLKGSAAECRAVWRARGEFRRMAQGICGARDETPCGPAAGRKVKSILYDYYIRRKRTWNQLFT